MEDKKISEMAELLFKGAKMLSQYCPDCKVPLFQKDERVFCPLCGRDVVFENNLDANKLDQKSEIASKEVPHEIKGCEKVEEKIEDVNNLLKALKSVEKAILKVCKKIEEDNDFISMEKRIKIVKELIEIHEMLKKLNSDFQ